MAIASVARVRAKRAYGSTQKTEQFLQACERRPWRRTNRDLLPVRFGHPHRQIGQRVIRLFDQVAIASMDALAVEHDDCAPRTGVKAVVDFYF